MIDLIVRRFTVGSAAIAACLAIAGCGSDDELPDRASAAAPDAPETGASAATEAAIDACSLLSADEITALLGTTVEGRPNGSGCLWENPSSYESVSVEIGSPNTAVNGTLPPPEPGFPEVGTPGPDGMRFLGSGAVEFPAGGRSNMVQVAVLSMSADQSNAAAVELARKISAKLPV